MKRYATASCAHKWSPAPFLYNFALNHKPMSWYVTKKLKWHQQKEKSNNETSPRCDRQLEKDALVAR